MADEFNPMDVARPAGKMAAAGDDDLRVTISTPGGATVETTMGRVRDAGNGVSRDHLRAFVERIERLNEEKQTIADDIKNVYGESKAMGFDPKAIRKVVAIRKKGEDKWREEESILDTYLAALGMLPDE